MTRQDDSGRLSADDAHILGVESSVIFGHTLKLNVIAPGPSPIDLDTLRQAVAERLPSQPRATQRVDTSGAEPRWVEARDFDIRDHVRRHVVPVCQSRDDLWNAVSGLMSEHLDRTRPLWTFDVIGPLADGREAIAARVHHAMADGISAVRFLHSVLWDVHTDPAAAAGRPTAPEPRGLVEALRMPGAAVRELGHRGSPSPFDRPITASRQLAFTVARLDEMKAIGASRPARATVNDVLLAIIAGGLRDWLHGRAERRDGVGDRQAAAEHLRAQVPVSLHHRDGDSAVVGNHDSFMNVDLPLAEADPLLRLDRISAETRERKRLDDAGELYDLFHALGRVKEVESAVRRFAGSARGFSVSISNVPGPSEIVSVAGREVIHLFSSSEPAMHHALRISAISSAGDVGIGLCTDPQALPDIARLADAIERSYVELRAAALSSLS